MEQGLSAGPLGEISMLKVMSNMIILVRSLQKSSTYRSCTEVVFRTGPLFWRTGLIM